MCLALYTKQIWLLHAISYNGLKLIIILWQKLFKLHFCTTETSTNECLNNTLSTMFEKIFMVSISVLDEKPFKKK